MTDREKQIDEMAEIIENNIYQYGSNPYPPEMTVGQYVASELVARNYRKMDEVTLRLDLGDRTPEEIEKIADMFNGEIKKQIAREILNTLNRTPHEYHEKKIAELAKLYGIEVSE